MSKPKIKELSQKLVENRKIKQEPTKKLSKFKLFILKLLSIELATHKFKTGDILKRKASDNPNELYEIKMVLFNEALEAVYMVSDFTTGKIITITGYTIESFSLNKGILPGTIKDVTDE